MSVLDNPILLVAALIALVAILFFVRKKPAAEGKGKSGQKQQPKWMVGSKKSAKAVPPSKQQPLASASTPASAPNPAPVSATWEQERVDTPTKVSVKQVDPLTEYQVYKQFGYFDKAAASLGAFLKKSTDKPHHLVLELIDLHQQAGDVDGIASALDDYAAYLSEHELADVVKAGLEAEPNHLELRVLAETYLGWDVSEVSAQIGDDGAHWQDAPTAAPVSPAETGGYDGSIDASIDMDGSPSAVPVSPSGAAGHKVAYKLVEGRGKIFGLTIEEVNSIINFMPADRSARLLAGQVDYDHALSSFNRAIAQVPKPAGIIIDTLKLDYQNGHIDNFAKHLWNLYTVLGRYGRSVKERMLGWGFSLGTHPTFVALEGHPNEQMLREIGLSQGYLEAHISQIKAQRLDLVGEGEDERVQQAVDQMTSVIREAEAHLMYGQLNQAMTTLEEGVLHHSTEPQMYIMLFDLYERAEDWGRFEQFARTVRNRVKDLPEEALLAMSHLSRRKNNSVVKQ